MNTKETVATKNATKDCCIGFSNVMNWCMHDYTIQFYMMEVHDIVSMCHLIFHSIAIATYLTNIQYML